jgi:hypothetical protein
MSWLFMVETAGKSLEEIDGIFERNKGWFARSKEERTKFSLGGPESAALRMNAAARSKESCSEILDGKDERVEHVHE